MAKTKKRPAAQTATELPAADAAALIAQVRALTPESLAKAIAAAVEKARIALGELRELRFLERSSRMRTNPSFGRRKKGTDGNAQAAGGAEGAGRSDDEDEPAAVDPNLRAKIKSLLANGPMSEIGLARRCGETAEDVRIVLGSLAYSNEVNRHANDGTWQLSE